MYHTVIPMFNLYHPPTNHQLTELPTQLPLRPGIPNALQHFGVGIPQFSPDGVTKHNFFGGNEQ